MANDWKLKLRYSRIETSYNHYTVIADGIVGELKEGFSCRPGNAYMGMKTWASSTEESADMIKEIGKEIGFEVIGKIDVFVTEPTEPPGENPHGYSINFTPYDIKE